MQELLRFTIPLTPVTKKNHQQVAVNKITGKPFVIPSKQYQDYEKKASQHLPKVSTLDVCCNVKCLFYMPTHRRCDLVNLLQAVDDIMVKYHLLEDDNYLIVQSHDGSRVLYDKENPRTEVIITKACADNESIERMCDKYCKYIDMFNDGEIDEDKFQEKCENCPLNELSI